MMAGWKTAEMSHRKKRGAETPGAILVYKKRDTR